MYTKAERVQIFFATREICNFRYKEEGLGNRLKKGNTSKYCSRSCGESVWIRTIENNGSKRGFGSTIGGVCLGGAVGSPSYWGLGLWVAPITGSSIATTPRRISMAMNGGS